jgi:hypothetical protein
VAWSEQSFQQQAQQYTAEETIKAALGRYVQEWNKFVGEIEKINVSTGLTDLDWSADAKKSYKAPLSQDKPHFVFFGELIISGNEESLILPDPFLAFSSGNILIKTRTGGKAACGK